MAHIRLVTDARTEWLNLLQQRSLYHAAPLHYLPMILHQWALIAAAHSVHLGVKPRRTACRRDRMLGVAEFVHLAFDLNTPLLRDKLARGMPHVVIAFDAHLVAQSHPKHALLPYNTKTWFSRACLRPVTEPNEMSNLVRRRDQFIRYPSMEFLVDCTLSLDHATEIAVFSEEDTLLVRLLLLRAKKSLNVTMTNIANYRHSEHTEYSRSYIRSILDGYPMESKICSKIEFD